MMLHLSIEHRTRYAYDRPVRGSKNEVRMTPATTREQSGVSSSHTATPEPSNATSYRDYFGTIVETFDVMGPHDVLDVVHTSTVRTSPPPSPLEDAVLAAWTPAESEAAVEFTFASPMVVWETGVTDVARSLAGSETTATVTRVLSWMRENLTYEPGSTVVGTPVDEVLAARRGVCQDYAHLCCALLRTSGIPARYVSGYFAPRSLEVGESVEAQSHAWVEVLVDGWGWWAVDPTNDQPAGDRHVKVGHGRDYADVVPFRGLHFGAAEQSLDVTVLIGRTPGR